MGGTPGGAGERDGSGGGARARSEGRRAQRFLGTLSLSLGYPQVCKGLHPGPAPTSAFNSSNVISTSTEQLQPRWPVPQPARPAAVSDICHAGPPHTPHSPSPCHTLLSFFRFAPEATSSRLPVHHPEWRTGCTNRSPVLPPASRTGRRPEAGEAAGRGAQADGQEKQRKTRTVPMALQGPLARAVQTVGEPGGLPGPL